ncbi:GNAT family N-acetyltransferase [Enterobacillus tribolii]|uniref:RimJ/RimL family protein N-acetyltransferase n=1 Tax=Enterobacillus tribolii TaxID=1487935 RepID=A0A370QQJ0_9GAMM|nr:GNAT family protein [Enterobacillus tribolii]MBW7981661.1 N-acetyltransferase [Enterobacillus tribolii]RDK91040.1 RimJ/RimL family protein N-acetyltransferase [Enterobacillus tribolii]
MELLLTTSRLTLRKFTHADLPGFIRYRSNPAVARFQTWENYTREDAEAFYAQQLPLAFNTVGSWFQIAVVRTEDGVLLGDVAVHFIDEGRQAELGMTFDEPFQRQGYAREALTAVITLLFEQLNKHRLVATIDARNDRAARLLEKLGFRREAHFRQNIFFKGGWGDEYAYGLLRSEWENAPLSAC